MSVGYEGGCNGVVICDPSFYGSRPRMTSSPASIRTCHKAPALKVRTARIPRACSSPHCCTPRRLRGKC